MLLLFILLVCYTLGAFGIIHTGIMQSISARSYAFETFRNRANVDYFRDSPSHASAQFQFRLIGDRAHAVTSEVKEDSNTDFPAAERAMAMGKPTDPAGTADTFHNLGSSTSTYSIVAGKRNQAVPVNPAWIMVQYGICLNVGCGNAN